LPTQLDGFSLLARLALSENNIQGSIPISLYNVSSLRTLEIDSNRLNGTLSSQISKLKNLLVLHLDVNRLSGTIPESLGDLVELSEFLLVSRFRYLISTSHTMLYLTNQLKLNCSSTICQEVYQMTSVSSGRSH